MSLEIEHIDVKDAIVFLQHKGCVFTEGEGDNFSIGVTDMGYTRGVILMCTHLGNCSLVHMYTDGTAQVGSLLYGAAWRAAKALGYKQITI